MSVMGLVFNGQKLMKLRIKSGYTKTRLQAVSGVSRKTITLLEAEARTPQLSTLLVLAKALDARIEEFYDEEEALCPCCSVLASAE